MNKPLAMIPARAGSKRVPGKNMKLFGGKPLLQLTIEKLQATDLFDKIVVSSEDAFTLESAKKWGAVPQERPHELATDDADTEAVIEWTIRQNPGYETILCAYTNVGAARGINPWVFNHSYGIYQQERRPLVTWTWDPLNPKVFKDAGQFYWIPVKEFVIQWDNCIELLDQNVRHYIIHPDECTDINTPEDWARAESLFGGNA